MNQAFAEAIQMLPEPNVDISSRVGEVEIFADPLLPRILFSLLSQSFQHGGPALSKIQMTARQSGESLVLFYEDDGKGISPGEKDRIFEFGYSSENMVSLFVIRELLGLPGITIAKPARGTGHTLRNGGAKREVQE